MSDDALTDLQLAIWAHVPPPQWPPGSPQAAVGPVSIVGASDQPHRDAAGRGVVTAIALENGTDLELEIAGSSPRFLETEI